jgi:hypothetical protein
MPRSALLCLAGQDTPFVWSASSLSSCAFQTLRRQPKRPETALRSWQAWPCRARRGELAT